VYLTPAEARDRWEENFATQHEESFEEAVDAALKR
jgi:hypothetical protein